MATAETLTNPPNESSNSIDNSEKELANDVIVGCRGTISVLFSGDERNEQDVPEYDIEEETVVTNSLINTQVASLNDVDKSGAEVPVIVHDIGVSEKLTSFDTSPDRLQNDGKTSETTLKPLKFSSILDSDSEDEGSDLLFNRTLLNHSISENPGKTSSFHSSDKPKDVKKSSTSGGRKLFIDSDTEDENENHGIESLTSNESVDRVNSSSRRQGDRDKTSVKSDYKLTTSKISALIDTDSEDDSSFIHETSASWSKEEPITQPTIGKEKWNGEKKRTGSIRATKEIAMREIKSESQRMLRESGLSLPYHRPKQRTLEEFMSRRKKLPILAVAPTTAAKVKLSVEIVGKVLEAKEKEAEHFFKSDSDSDGDTQCNSANPTLDIKDNKSTEAIKKVVENEEEHCKINDEGAEQGDKRNGVSRNLFASKYEFPEAGSPSLFTERDNEARTMETLKGFEQEPRINVEHSELMATEMNIPKDAGCTSISEDETASHIDKSEAIEDDSEEFQLRLSEDQYTLLSKQRSPENEKVLKIDPNKSESITGKWPVDEDNVIKVNENGKADSEEFEADCNNDSKVNNEPIGHVYGLPLPEFENDKPPLKKNEKILPDIMKIIPKLQGSPNMLIDLTSHKVGVSSLMERFLKHSVVKKPVESIQDIEITFAKQTEIGATILTEILPYKIPFNEKNDDPELSKPGAKLTRLKEELQRKMSIHRNKEWEQKEQETKALMTDDLECEMEEEDEEEEEFEISSSGESEPDEDDMPMKKVGNKKKYQSPFVDLDAEVSGEESEDDEEEDDEEEDNEVSGEESREDKDGEDVQNEQDDDANISENGEENELIQRDQVRELKRITKGFQDEDSDDEDPVSTAANITPSNGRHFSRTKTDVDIFASDNNSNEDWFSYADGDLPGSQRRVDEKRQLYATPLVANNSLSIISPLTQLTALNAGSKSSNTDSSFTQEPSEVVSSLLADETPIEKNSPRVCDPEKLEKLQKKLFHDAKDLPNDNDLVDLCSNNFSDSVCDNSGLDKIMHTSNKTHVSDAELFELCSGTFATQRDDDERLESGNDCNEQIGRISPCNSPSSHKQTRKLNESSGKLRIIFSSDDESGTNNLMSGNAKKKIFKRKPKILQLSDDENDSEDEDDGKSGFDSDEQFVDYDSEENEIPYTKKGVIKAAAGFVDKEAELSESDWGSADEDEKDLDKLEMEEGDFENIDEEEVRKQAGKLHMRQVLDQDQREVRLLQEMLLEDGELHSDGAARQRKFKWKNIDKLGDDDQDQSRDPEEGVTVDPIDVESELEWRKQRLEREQFLQRQKVDETSADIEIETQNSQLFELGMKALKKNKCSKSTTMDTTTIVAVNSEVSAKRHTIVDLFASSGCGKKMLQSAIHRGSFLARGEESLARLSRITNQNSNQAITKPKSSRNFVFAHLSPAIDLPVEDEPVSSQEKDITTNDKTRKRKPAFSMTPLASKKSKKKHEQIDGHKLFS